MGSFQETYTDQTCLGAFDHLKGKLRNALSKYQSCVEQPLINMSRFCQVKILLVSLCVVYCRAQPLILIYIEDITRWREDMNLFSSGKTIFYE